jgi:uncharacterized SAM-binding protein YcdF (DUF218 family)
MTDRRAPRRIGPRPARHRSVVLVRIAGLLFALALVLAGAFGVELAQVRAQARAAGGAPLTLGPVLVLGGDRARVVAALELEQVAAGTQELILSAGAAEDLVALGRACDEPTLRCVTPDPATTRGEALLAARLAEEEGWPALSVVTSSWHAHRARLHLEACLDIPVVVVGVAEPAGGEVAGRRVWREALGALDARIRPECPGRR